MFFTIDFQSISLGLRQLLFIAGLLIISFAQGQENGAWHLLDPEIDGVLGISSNRAYDYLADREADTVIVAILDNGAELGHEDMQGIYWVNEDEIPGNGIDDDKNGYIDDIHGWNFLGNAEGENLKMETVGLTRLYSKVKKRFDGKKRLEFAKSDLAEFDQFKRVEAEWKKKVEENKLEYQRNVRVIELMDDAEALLKKKLKKKELSKENLEKLKSNNKDVLKAKDLYLQMLKYNENQDTYRKFNKNLKKSLDTRLNPDFKNREEIVGDDVDDLNDTIYGNPEVDARGPYHGTSVAGLVAALNDDKGIDGVARHVKIMVLRMVPNGDERDKDVALAIRYAVENGASIINCSFAKKYGMHAEFVELVTQEALDNDVLIVHGSGNYGTNNDSIPYHPEGRLNNGEWAPNWINVGASQSKDDEHLVAVFSNYGKESVDVLAPGVQIRSLALGDKYSMGSGTSLSAPILSGVAAVIKSYFPHLTASQLKEVILESAYQPKTTELNKPGLSKSDEEKKLVPLTDLFATPGIVNLYRAIKLAEEKYPAQPKEQASDEK